MADEKRDAGDEARREANTAMGTGLSIGAFGVASAVLLGAVCPVCVVAAPALIGYGVFKRIQCARARPDPDEAEVATGADDAPTS